MATTVIEVVEYRFKANVDMKSILAISEQLNAFLAEQDGFQYRSMIQRDDNLFSDFIYWTDEDCAQKGSAAFESHPIAEKLAMVMEMENVTISLYNVLSELQACEKAA
ncbi:hypothetical protein HR060_15695 [Catenovulum sp. SM1970]|uniref:hypothetical protein n=1 Tax=Marinifaba aquimaris TaxID=2741323 RepID=UPI001571E4D5|nr:hypothetical protein [Marinifaba aquimaris]NTS78295.1 hypothetical protein [Marinifaba aquimaris]